MGESSWGPFFQECADPCWVVRVEERGFVLEAANRAWEASTGLSAATLVGRPMVECIPPSLWTPALERLLQAVAQRTATSYEHEFVFSTGKLYWQTRIVPWPASGPVTHVLGVARDLTDLAETHRAIAESERQFRGLAERVPDVVYRYRYQPDRGFDYVSPSVEQITGRSREQLYTDPLLLRRAVHPGDSEQLLAIEEGREHEILLRWCRPDGTMVWTESRNSYVYDDAGRVVAVEGIARDVTQRIEDEHQRIELDRRYVETQRLESLGVLAGGLAHAFNNLLTGILGRASLMHSEVSEVGEARDHLRQIEQAAGEAADLCRQMLTYSGKGRTLVREIDLSDVISETAPLLQVAVSKDAKLELLLTDIPAVVADTAQFRQVLVSLVTNASEALPDGRGTVRVATGAQVASRQDLKGMMLGEDLPEGTYVFLEVRDDGRGMSPEVRERIFEPFYSTKFAGRGLGLSAVLGIVRKHRGAIAIQTAPGQGTVMKVLFPAVEKSAQRRKSGAGALSWKGHGTILVVDDEEIVRNVTSRILKKLGFDSILAEDGAQAVERFAAHQDRIRAVILDLTMPKLGGDQAFERLRALRPDVPVLLMSGYHEQEAHLAGKHGAGFLQKPFDAEGLAEAMRNLLESARADRRVSRAEPRPGPWPRTAPAAPRCPPPRGRRP